MAKAVGIDLGTTNSVVSVLEAGEPVVIPNAEQERTTPSTVGFSKTGELLVGDAAKRQAITNPDRTIRSVKRQMGGKVEPELEEEHQVTPILARRILQKLKRNPTVGSVKHLEGTSWNVEIDGKRYSAQEISARILQKLKRDAEAYLGDSVNQAVVTVPAYFDDAQRTATKEAGQIAGLEVLRVINEPTAAALAYGLDKEGQEQTILVFDLGGGMFDVSVLEIGEGVFEVKATHGDTHLGGDDWDQRVIDWLVKEFKNTDGVDLAKDKMALQRLKEAAEKAKIELSQVTETNINLPFITATSEGPKHLDLKLTRARFQELTADLVDRCRGPFEQAISDADLNKGSIDQFILVGGSTRMPAIVDLVRELTGKEPHKGVNPDEVVAMGAAIQAGVLKGDVKDVLPLDVTPLSLGIERGGTITKLIKRNTTLPTCRSEVFTPDKTGPFKVKDYTLFTTTSITVSVPLPYITFQVLQGEREKPLGSFRIDLPEPSGEPQIEVTLDIDANGILHVSAKDRATGKEQSMTITGQSSLSKDEIDRMVRDAEAHAAEDRQREEEADVRNNADSLVYQTEKLLGDQGDKFIGDEHDRVESALKELKDVLGGSDTEAIRRSTDGLMTASQTFAQRLYEQASQEQSGGGPGPAGGPGDDFWLRKGLTPDDLGRHEEELACENRGLEIDPMNYMLWNNRGSALHDLGRYAEALWSYDRGLELNNEHARLWSNKGRTLYKLDLYAEALECVKRAAALDGGTLWWVESGFYPSDSDFWLDKGNVFHAAGRWQEALACAEQGLEINPEDYVLWNNKGNELSELGHCDEALDCYDRGLALNQQYGLLWSNKAHVLWELGRYKEGLTYLRGAIHVDPDSIWWVSRRNTMAELRRWEDAAEGAESGLDVDPGRFAFWWKKGLELRDLGLYEDAISCYNRGLELNDQSAPLWNDKGVALQDGGRYEESLACHEHAVLLDPTDSNFWLGKGNAFHHLRRWEEALLCAEHGLSLDPHNHVLWNNKGNELKALGRLNEARACYDRGLELNPRYALLWRNKGKWMYDSERYREALHCAERGLEIDSEDHVLWEHKAKALRELGRADEARACYERAEALTSFAQKRRTV